MAISPGSLVVKKSTIPGSGNGLFTKKLIPAGTRIIEYEGKVTTWKDADHEDGDNAYIYFVKRTHVIDARKNKKWLARYANDAKGLTRVKGIVNNCEYVEESSRVYIHSKTTIPAGAEILVPYGPEYWQVIRYNKKLAEKELAAVTKKESAKKALPKSASKKSVTKNSKGSVKAVPGKKVPAKKVSAGFNDTLLLPPAKAHRTVRPKAKVA